MSAGDASGLRAIEDAVERHIERLSPSLPFYTLPCPSGEDLIQVQVYQHPQGHWHYLTYGFSCLFEGPTAPDPRGRDGLGYELGIRVPVQGAQPSTQPVDLLRALAKLLVDGRRVLAPNHTLPLGGPIALGSMHTAFAVAADPELGTVQTPLGTVEMLLLVGITAAEVARCAEGSTARLLEQLRDRDPLLVTHLKREEVTDTGQSSGTRLDAQHVDSVSWIRLQDPVFRLPKGYLVRVSPRSASETFRAALEARLRSSGSYCLGDGTRLLRFELGAQMGARAEPGDATLVVTFAADRVDPRKALTVPGHYIALEPVQIVFENDDERIERVLEVLRSDNSDLHDGTIRVVAAAGKLGGELMLAVESLDSALDPIVAVEGVRGHTLTRLNEELGGPIRVVYWHPDIARTAFEALRPCTADEIAIEDDRLVLIGPVVRVQAGSMSDARAAALGDERRALVAELLGRAVELDQPWRIEQV